MRQLALELRTWGGARRGAGRKPNGERAGASHLRRPEHKARYPLHVTLKIAAGVPNLRSVRAYRGVFRALVGVRQRSGFRVCHYSVQGNHLHLLLEAEDRQQLSSGMRSLAIRLARRINRALGRRGALFADRYHARELKTPREVRLALRYVLLNARGHVARSRALTKLEVERLDPYSSALWFDGWRGAPADTPMAYVALAMPGWAPLGRADLRASPDAPREVSDPKTFLLRRGWRRLGALRTDEVPGGAPSWRTRLR